MVSDELGFFRRGRATIERRGLQSIMGSRWMRARLAASRREPVDGRTLDEDIAVMLGLDDLSNHSDLRRLSPPRARIQVAAGIAVVDALPPPDVVTQDRRIPGPAGEITLRAYTPPAAPSPSPAIVYIHGGGWVTGSIATHDALCRRLAAGATCRVVSVEYRLAPEHRFPAAVDDALAATRWVLGHAEELAIDATRIAVAGDSAGGNLSAVIARRTRGDARRPALQVLLYPALDGTMSLPSHRTFAERYFLTAEMCEWYYAHYVGSHDRRDPDVSPLLAPETSDVPALIYTSGFDPLRDEGAAYAERLAAAGTQVTLHEFSPLPHGFVLMTAGSRAALAATEAVARDVGRTLGITGR